MSTIFFEKNLDDNRRQNQLDFPSSKAQKWFGKLENKQKFMESKIFGSILQKKILLIKTFIAHFYMKCFVIQ